ncbi:MAG: hypothetical protein GAK45_01805 [Pseudomonas citronellolis]|nr:MAG: hypothetical protein GAK45_01805 [Pseudomonas citronellolis]
MRRRQRGLTLISMMVGLMISLLVILVMMTSFKTLLAISTEASREALQDGELATSLAALQMDIQGAGFGLDSTNQALVQGSISLTGDAKALLWRYLDGTTPVCAGVVERSASDADSGQVMRVVSRLRSSNCSTSADLTSLSWSWGEDLLHFRNQSTAQLQTSLGQGTCSPFGTLSDAGQHPIVTLTAPSALEQAGATAASVSYSVCLLNLSASGA